MSIICILLALPIWLVKNFSLLLNIDGDNVVFISLFLGFPFEVLYLYILLVGVRKFLLLFNEKH